MPKTLTTIAFDADDTLWHNERFFRVTQERFAELLMDHTPQDMGPEQLDRLLLDAEMRNLGRYGYGVKGFTLSMIETAIEVTDARVPASVIQELLEAGQMMLSYPIELLPHARDAVTKLATDHHLVLITKGDLLDQERKLAQSGLGEFFDAVEIVSDKTPEVYSDIFRRHGHPPEQTMMVGNSMRSDILPVLEAGGWATFVPHGLIWDHEHAEPPENHARYFEIDDLGALPTLISQL
ncbi:HAD family hydrolase [Epibacterium sp. SM1979]|uniref:HAD family hydrolase n=1 Tax=Tritonibacter litoralis TaxID=2662264 RepID=A0A843YGY6_9RHOB|nr:HAD family hydrolase [Tritonibacter litoralis]MQQ08704.1 HAD family hydrolase [Tritonibacter litoralis]